MGSEPTFGSENDWLKTTWGEIVELKYGKSLKDYKGAEGEVPVFGTNGPVGWCDKALCEFPSIIVGRKGAYRGIHFSDRPFFVIDTAFYIVPKIDINLRWAYYFLLTQDINGLDSGSAIPSTRKEDFYALPAYVPPRWIQDEIVNHLDGLNNKITLNRQLNQTLEQMAQALFKSWFVDFDPVIDNALAAGNPIPDDLQDRAERRQLQLVKADHKPLPENIRKLFPSEFELTESLGWVPKGWECKPIYSLADFVNGAAYKQFNPNSEQRGLPIVKIAELKAGITQSTGFSDIAMPEKYAIKNQDILFSWSGNPDTSIDTFIWSHGDAWLNQHIFRVDPAKEINRFFLLAMLRHLNPVFAEIARDKQTTGLGHVTVKDLKELYVIVPNEKIMSLSGSKLESLFSKAFATVLNTQHVAQLRDTLLPKLISGELRIPEAQAQLEAVLG